jgi:GTP cyclohydrolase IA
VRGGPTSPDDERPVPGFDHARAEAAIRELLLAVGEDPEREGLRGTPGRVARAYEELFSGMRVSPADVLTTTFDLGHDELVLVKDIEVWSSCEHHLLPFTGVAHVGYVPSADGRITGLSKLARLVDVFARLRCRSGSPLRSRTRSCRSWHHAESSRSSSASICA